MQPDPVFQPFFGSRQANKECRQLQTVPQQRKFSLYFAQHGCLRCDSQDALYGSNGLCSKCFGLITHRLRAVVAEEEKRLGISAMDPNVDPAAQAYKALMPSVRKLGGMSRLCQPAKALKPL
ncbi:MAG: hypothetical protein ACRD4R_08610 [Candidatus Acidiferrales bacterium]